MILIEYNYYYLTFYVKYQVVVVFTVEPHKRHKCPNTFIIHFPARQNTYIKIIIIQDSFIRGQIPLGLLS